MNYDSYSDFAQPCRNAKAVFLLMALQNQVTFGFILGQFADP